MQYGDATGFPRGVCLIDCSSLALRPSGLFLEECHQNTLLSRATASADLEPPKWLGLGLGLGLGLELGLGN